MVSTSFVRALQCCQFSLHVACLRVKTGGKLLQKFEILSRFVEICWKLFDGLIASFDWVIIAEVYDLIGAGF